MTLPEAIAYLRARNLYVLDKGSKPYKPVNGYYPPCPSNTRLLGSACLPTVLSRSNAALTGSHAGSGSGQQRRTAAACGTANSPYDGNAVLEKDRLALFLHTDSPLSNSGFGYSGHGE